MGGKLVVVGIVSIAVIAGASSLFGRAYLAEHINPAADAKSEQQSPVPIAVLAEPIPLNTDDATVTAVGELQYVAGWRLTSDHEDFGGLSGLLMRGPQSLLAISDQGDWIEADFDLHAHQSISNAKTSLFDPTSKGGDKEDFDAESLIALSDGFLVGFEQNHRIMKVKTLASTAAPELFETGVDLKGLSSNSGIEAMAYLPDGALIMFAENGRNIQGRLPVWHVSAGSVTNIDFIPPKNYSPTDAAALPDGSLLLLLRHYSVLDGVSAKILHITAEEIKAGIIRGREIGSLRAPLSVDNMEGLDVIMQPDGSVRLYLVSDDNFSSRQDTLLMVFDWKP
ncbi:MAG: esterase-like activity of phytase family protein [Kordiimonadaceae bacterium]|nr:esterase-like activity of phytase family protein [Kordiimonadaceae bacterium]